MSTSVIFWPMARSRSTSHTTSSSGSSGTERIQPGSLRYFLSFMNSVKSTSPGDCPKPVKIAAASLRCCVPWFTTW